MADAGLVLPAYDPDAAAVTDYVEALHALDPVTTVRVELDAPPSNSSPEASAHAPGDSVSESTDATHADRTSEPPDTAHADRVPAPLAASEATVNVVDERRGKGLAITHGFDALDTEIRGFVDADGSTPPHSVADVLEAVSDGADLAVGSRRHPAADVRGHQTVLRRHLGDAFARLARVVLDVDLHDYQCGAKATTAAVWRRVRHFLTEPGFAWDVELVGFADHLGCDVREVPVAWEDRPHSTVDPTSTAAALGRALVRTRLRTGAARGLFGLLEDVFGEQEPLVRRHPSSQP